MDREDQIKYAEQIIACGCSDELKAILEKDFPELTLDKDKRIKEVLSRNLEGNAQFRWQIQRIGLHPDDVLFLIKSRSIEWQDDYCEEDLKTRFAFYMYKDEPNVLFLSNLFVEEASRNKGFGTKILIAAEKVAEVIGASCIRLKVKQNTSANAWYRKKGYGYMSSEDGYDWLEKTLEYMKPSEWSEEDEKRIKQLIYDTEHIRAEYEKSKEKVGEEFNNALIIDCDEQIAWLKSLSLNLKKRNEDIEKLCSNEWSEEDERMLSRCIKSIECSKQFADSESYKAAKDVEMNWLKSLPERFNLQPKQEWSEEDEANIDYLIDYFNSFENGGKPELPLSAARNFCNWLYTLKDKIKMSDESKQ